VLFPIFSPCPFADYVHSQHQTRNRKMRAARQEDSSLNASVTWVSQVSQLV
jgi:hypothetical protein